MLASRSRYFFLWVALFFGLTAATVIDSLDRISSKTISLAALALAAALLASGIQRRYGLRGWVVIFAVIGFAIMAFAFRLARLVDTGT